jgi:hypothetical protein
LEGGGQSSLAGGEGSLAGSEGFTGSLSCDGIGGVADSSGGQVQIGVGSFEMGLESCPSFVSAWDELWPDVATDGETTGIGNDIAANSTDKVLGSHFVVACDGEAQQAGFNLGKHGFDSDWWVPGRFHAHKVLVQFGVGDDGVFSAEVGEDLVCSNCAMIGWPVDARTVTPNKTRFQVPGEGKLLDRADWHEFFHLTLSPQPDPFCCSCHVCRQCCHLLLGIVKSQHANVNRPRHAIPLKNGKHPC